jgi:hypothetical protein
MHLRGLERTVPLRLSNEVIAALALEAQLRETSLGQLVGEIVASAVATGLSGLLDGEPSSVDATQPSASNCEALSATPKPWAG